MLTRRLPTGLRSRCTDRDVRQSSDVTVPFRCPVRIAGRGPKGHPEALDPWS
jgi:hypothetical protein